MSLPTCDPDVRIEEQSVGYTRYVSTSTGQRWSVSGICDQRGVCLIGAVIATPNGLVEIQSKDHIRELQALLGKDRIDSDMDVPVGPGFRDCCPLVVTVL